MKGFTVVLLCFGVTTPSFSFSFPDSTKLPGQDFDLHGGRSHFTDKKTGSKQSKGKRNTAYDDSRRLSAAVAPSNLEQSKPLQLLRGETGGNFKTKNSNAVTTKTRRLIADLKPYELVTKNEYEKSVSPKYRTKRSRAGKRLKLLRKHREQLGDALLENINRSRREHAHSVNQKEKKSKLKSNRKKPFIIKRWTKTAEVNRSKKQNIPSFALAHDVGGPLLSGVSRLRHSPSSSHGPHYFMPPVHKYYSHGVEHRYVGGPIHRYLSRPVNIGNIGRGSSVRQFEGGANIAHFDPCRGVHIADVGPCLGGAHIENVGGGAHISDIIGIGGATHIGPVGGSNGGASIGSIAGGINMGGVGGGTHYDEVGNYGENRFGSPRIMGAGVQGGPMRIVYPVHPPPHNHLLIVNRPVHHTLRIPVPVPVRGPPRIVVVNRPVPMPPKRIPVPVLIPGPPLPPKMVVVHHQPIINGPCEVSPCRNGGTCSSVGTDFRCVCALGYKGDRCDVQSKCIPNPCKNFGKCTELVKDYECTCHYGFHGKMCDVENKCEPNPCHNGGYCTETRDNYICSCSQGFMGKNCEQESKCHPVNPCQNSGICSEDLVGYKCGCPDNYGGINCEVHINNNACESSPCLNGGTCISDTGDPERFSCTCPSSFSGQKCQEGGCTNCPSPAQCVQGTCILKDDYDSKQVFFAHPNSQGCGSINPCLFGGHCIPNGVTYDCICTDGRNGRHCEISVRCDGCSRHALCESDRCVCKPGYIGDGYHCRRKQTHCHPNPCENGGTCHEENHMYTSEAEWWCECMKGYSGQTCTKFDPCSGFTCHNGGRCESSSSQPQCTCVSPYAGATCELDNVCLPLAGRQRNPCLNGGTCQLANGQAQCLCTQEYEGHYCSKYKCDKCDRNAVCSQGLCKCKSPYTGDGFTCIIADIPTARRPTLTINYCIPNPCTNGATCIEGKTTYYCVCSAEFYGRTCSMRREVKIVYKEKETFTFALCHPNPCLHGGICKEVSSKDFECICVNVRYKGRFCDVDMCSECDVHARCVHGKCICRDGYEGDGYSCNRIVADKVNNCGGCPVYAQCETDMCVCQPGYTMSTHGAETGRRSCIPLPVSLGIVHVKALPAIVATVKATNKASVQPTVKAPITKAKSSYSSDEKHLNKTSVKDKPDAKSHEWSEDIIVTEYKSLGCWADSPNWRDPLRRTLIALEGLDTKIMDDYHIRKQPISKCAEIARGLGYKIFAVQNGGQCFSGPPSRNYKKYGPSEECKSGVGGSLANDVYKL